MRSRRNILLIVLALLFRCLLFGETVEEARPFLLLPKTLPIVRQTTWNVCDLFHSALMERLFQSDCRIIKQESLTDFLNARNLDARAPIPKSLYVELVAAFQVDAMILSHLLSCEIHEEDEERIGILQGNLRIVGKDGVLRTIIPFQYRIAIPKDSPDPQRFLVREAVNGLPLPELQP